MPFRAGQLRRRVRPEETSMATTDRFEIPPEMRAFAERSVEQARQAFDSFISAAQNAVVAFEGHAETARKGAKDVTERAMTFAQQNIASSFELAQQLMRAKDVQEVLKLQTDYVRRQMQALAEQAKELNEAAGKAARGSSSPPP
jgi:phasin